MIITTAAATLVAAAMSAPVAPAYASPAQHTVQYRASDALIANPERGFDHTVNTHYYADGSGYTPLDQQTLAGYRADGITQVVRVFYMEKFAHTKRLDRAWLRLVQQDFDTARSAGVSIITRFAYAEGTTYPYSPPYGDADLPTVLAHIRQLTPLLRHNSDVIPVLQSGFIGLWGEGYYTDHFASDPSNPGELTAADWAKRRAVVGAELKALPADRSIQLRTMQMKQEILGVPTGTAGALTADEAYRNTAKARIGHHNDCFLAPFGDYGTFLSDPITLDEEYLAQDSAYLPVGGETCAVNPPRSEWPNASAELARYHYSYLNRDYLTDVLDSWGQTGLDEAAKRLGYRFVMVDSSVTDSGRHSSAQVSVQIRNVGWAAPYNRRPAYLVLTSQHRTVRIPFHSDARRWAAGTTTTVTAAVRGLGPGRYHAYLSLPAADGGTARDPKFAIRTANVDTWDAARGLNDLQQSVIISNR
ncbi:DUF4832 domain-containing protein [Microlunatus sp. Gsoil 973]|uniref:DUF4832 domain-containing protein n=1 Tax=Microlunatus sp. Gsoil 973 TaxID=2672569 RepID=UPI001E65D930|nr:DUF4832 domain-containing protein [Microlunatus sp. Gsoil 973]